MPIIFQLPYTDFLINREYEHLILNKKNANEEANNTNVRIIILDVKRSIRSYLETRKPLYDSNRLLSNIYIASNIMLEPETQIALAQSIINEHGKLHKLPDGYTFNVEINSAELREAILYDGRLTVHRTSFADGTDYIFYNTAGSDATVHAADDVVEYVCFDQRHDVGLFHAKQYSNGSFALFKAFPMLDVPKVIILDGTWSIIAEARNKIAIKRIDNLIIWMLTTRNTFVNFRNDQPFVTDVLYCSAIYSNKLTNAEIKRIVHEFHCLHFGALKVTEKSFSAHDEKNNLFVFCGLLYENELGSFQNTLKLL